MINKTMKGWLSTDSQLFYEGGSLPKQHKHLPPGYYKAGYNPFQGVYVSRISLKDQNLIRVPDSETDKIIQDITSFWNRKELFDKYKFPYKRGILMYGPAGVGKTSAIQLIIDEVVKMDGVCFKFSKLDLFLPALELLRKTQKEVPVLVIMEDIDYLLKKNNLSEMLNLLDGIDEHHSNVIYLATTNNPEALHENIANRPSRFDRKVYFGPPNASMRHAYFLFLFKNEDSQQVDLDKWVEETEGLSLAHLKELFISVILFGNDFSESVNELHNMGGINTETEDLDEEED